MGRKSSHFPYPHPRPHSYSHWIYTMLCCTTRLRAVAPLASILSALLLASSALVAIPASAQMQAHETGQVRNFPDAARRATLVITGLYDAELNGKPVRMAPGVRLFSTGNALVPIHTAVGSALTVNYINEVSTGMLLTAWILSPSEAAQKRATP